MAERAAKRILELPATALMLLAAFLLPLKFGTLAVVPEATSFFLPDFFSYLIISWPASAFGMVAGVCLLLAMAAFPEGVFKSGRKTFVIMCLWSFAVPLLSLLGFVNATCFDFAILQFSHLLGVGAWFATVWIFVNAGHGRKIFIALALGTLLTAWLGLEQYFWGFRQSREFILEQEANGIPVNPDIKARAFDTRVFATFTGCNFLAGYLLLMWLPVTALLWNAGRRVEPEKVSRVLFALLGGGALFAVLIMTKSRAAYLALALTAGFFALAFPVRRRWRITLALSAIAVVAGGTWYIHHFGRGFESMAARLDYLRSSVLLLGKNWLLGCGWGEFFFGHMQLKAIVSKEAAHDPHNILMTAAQGGTFLMLTMAAALFYPLYVTGRQFVRRFRQGEEWLLDGCLFCGILMLIIHSMMDINIQIPAILAAFAVAVMCHIEEDRPLCKFSFWKKAAAMALLALLAVTSFAFSLNMLKGEIAFDRLNSLCSMRDKTMEEAARIQPGQVHEALTAAAKLRPYSSFIYSVAGDYFAARGLLYDAEKMYDMALERAPRRAMLYQRKSFIAVQRSDREKAKKYMEKARELFPYNEEYAP